VLGQTLTLDGARYTIIGVLPEAATAFPLDRQQIWVPRPAEVTYLAASQVRSAITGSIRVARRAGKNEAHSATSSNVTRVKSAHPRRR
jgi:hypothetical protein